MTTQKEIVKALDIAAARADMIDASAATPNQCWFLAKLLMDAGLTADYIDCGYADTSAVLTKRTASEAIDHLLTMAEVAA